MGASSIMEEDIMGISFSRAHIHPSGVLWYSAAESVILFGNAEDLHQASHTLPDVMDLQDEAITVWAMAPLQAHVAMFMVMWHLNPTHRGWRTAHSSPTNTSQ